MVGLVPLVRREREPQHLKEQRWGHMRGRTANREGRYQVQSRINCNWSTVSAHTGTGTEHYNIKYLTAVPPSRHQFVCNKTSEDWV